MAKNEHKCTSCTVYEVLFWIFFIFFIINVVISIYFTYYKHLSHKKENVLKYDQTLYLIIHSATGYFKEKNGEKYLIIDSTKKYEEVFSRIRSEIKTINGGKNCFMKKIMLELKLIPIMIYLWTNC